MLIAIENSFVFKIFYSAINLFKQTNLSPPSLFFFRLKVAVGDDHNLVIDEFGNLYVWGDNSKGQLGLGHTEYSPRISILDFLQGDSIA